MNILYFTIELGCWLKGTSSNGRKKLSDILGIFGADTKVKTVATPTPLGTIYINLAKEGNELAQDRIKMELKRIDKWDDSHRKQ